MTVANDTVKGLMTSLGDADMGNEIADALNSALALAAQSAYCVPTWIVATSTSTTTNFGSLRVGDKVVMIPAVAGNSIFYTVATAATLPAAAIIGNLYVVLRAFRDATASAVTF